MTDSPSTAPGARFRNGTAVAAKVLFVAVVLTLLLRPAILYPVGGPTRCDFCFRTATGTVTYRSVQRGTTFTMDVCNDHRRDAPKRAGAGSLGYFKMMAWLVMAASSGFALVTLGRMLFVAPPPPGAEFGAGCVLIALLPMAIAEVLHLSGLHLTGRIIAWVSVFFMLTAAMAIAIQPEPGAPGPA